MQALISIPATTALLLALIYAVGAITRSAELAHAGVPVRVAFPLIPIEQDLARGVQVAVQPSVLIAAILIVIGVGLFILAAEIRTRSGTSNPSETSNHRKAGAAERILSFGAGSALLIYSLTSAPLVFASTIIGGLMSLAVLMTVSKGHRLRPPARVAPALVVMLVAIAFSASSLFLELVDPPPLPTVTLQSTPGGAVSGSLITFADGTWYLGAPHGRILAIDSRDVLRATIASSRPSKLSNENLWRLLGL